MWFNHSCVISAASPSCPFLPLDLGELTGNLHFNDFSWRRKNPQKNLVALKRRFCYLLKWPSLHSWACGIIPKDLQEVSRNFLSPEEHSTTQKSRILGSLAICYLENVSPASNCSFFLKQELSLKYKLSIISNVFNQRACLVVLQILT